MTTVRRRAKNEAVSAPPPSTTRHWWLNEGGFRWDPLPLEISTDRALSPWAKLLFPMMSNLTVQRGYAYKSHRALARLVGCSVDTVEDALGCLVARGLLTKTAVVGGSNQYRVVGLHLVYDDDYRHAVATLNRRARTPEQCEELANATLVLERSAEEHRQACPVCGRRNAAQRRRRAKS